MTTIGKALRPGPVLWAWFACSVDLVLWVAVFDRWTG